MKALVLLSGGMDSGVLLAQSLTEFESVEAISFEYGSKHNRKELESAVLLAKKYDVTHTVIPLRFLDELFDSSLLQGGESVPDGTYNQDNMRSTVVPFRNGIMLAVAVGYAENLQIDEVLIGSHSDDHGVYPDCRTEFTEKFSEAASLGTYTGVRVRSPFTALSKSEIAAAGRQLDFDFSLTWTCYKGHDFHCGLCAACNARKEALLFEEGKDPTRYEG